jgi:hypothetical protein
MVAAATALTRPPALDILRRLTGLLPLDAQLADFYIDGAAVRLSGYCRDPQALVHLLRHSGFHGVTAMPTVGRSVDGRMRFEIAMSAGSAR